MDLVNLPLPHTVVLVDIAGFGKRTNERQLQARNWLFTTLDRVFAGSGAERTGFSNVERGDGALIMVPATVSLVQVLRAVTGDLAAAVHAHNAAEPAHRMVLRAAVHSGHVHTDRWGSVGSDVNLAARFDSAAPFRRAMDRTDAEFGVIVSTVVYDQVVREGYDGIDPLTYQRIRVRIKDVDAAAWISVAGARPPLPGLGLRRPRWFVTVAAVVVTALAVTAGLVLPADGDAPSDRTPFAAYADYLLDGYPSAVHPTVLALTDFPTADRCRDAERWAVGQGGAFASGTPVRLTLIGQGQRTIVVQKVTAKVVQRAEPMAGTELGCESSGAKDPIPIGVDLDQPDPVARKLDEHGTVTEPYFAGTVVELRSDESVVFDIVPTTVACTCSWQIELTYVDNGAAEVLTVNGVDDQPFRTASTTRVARRFGEFGGAWNGP